jgi:hypothetical protein
VLLVRQARTLRRILTREGGEQGRLQEPVEQGRQVQIESWSKHKNKYKDEQRSRKKDGHGRKVRAMLGASDVDSSSAYSSSSSCSSQDEGDQRNNKKASKNLSGLSCFTGDGFCGMARSSGSKKSH